jgi:hypothetical protein
MRLEEVTEARLARLVLRLRQPPPKRLVAEPDAVGVHNVALTVLREGKIPPENLPIAQTMAPDRPLIALPLPHHPSIAFLPFENMGGDMGQQYFADGIVEEIITALSRFSGLFVMPATQASPTRGGPSI